MTRKAPKRKNFHSVRMTVTLGEFRLDIRGLVRRRTIRKFWKAVRATVLLVGVLLLGRHEVLLPILGHLLGSGFELTA